MQANYVDPTEPANKLRLNIDLDLAYSSNQSASNNSPSIDDSYSLFTDKINMLMHVCQSDNAFAYIVANRSLRLHGDTTLGNNQNFQHLLSIQPLQTVNWLNDCQNSIAVERKLDLLLLVAMNNKGDAIGFIGTYLDSQLASNLALKAKIENGTDKLISLIAKDFNNEVKLNQSIIILQQKQASYSQMAELNQDFICVKDENHRIIYANKALLETFENTNIKRIVGCNSTQLYEPETSAQIIESDLVALENGIYKSNQLVRLANNQERILNTTQKRFVGIDGKTYLMSVSRDVTQREILINDLKRSNEDLDNFAYVASHDLRSPLNVIKRLITWVKEDCEGILPADSNENLDLVLNRTERMEKLLVDLLSYSRIGKEYQEASDVNLRELVIELLSLIDLPMGFVVNCDNVDIRVATVPFNVVMLNLLSNAIKHHDSGNAKIEIKAKNGPRGCVISILDNGPGIQEKDRERIFQLFETLRPRDEVEGSGMGLSVVKKIVEHYGGNIKVENNQPRGTKFVINWPLNNFARSVLENLND